MQPFLATLSNTSVMCPFFIESYLLMKSACFTYCNTTYLPSEGCKSSIPPCRIFLQKNEIILSFFGFSSSFFPLCLVRPLYPLRPHLAQLKVPILQGRDREVSKPFVLFDSASHSGRIFRQCCKLAPARELRWTIPQWYNIAMLSQRT